MNRLKTLRAQFLVEHLDLEQATGVEGASWEHFQLDHLNDDGPLRIECKSRQIAWSWLAAAEAVADAVLDRRPSIFVSINEDEAKEKVRYARSVLQAIHGIRLPRLVRDNDLGLEFDTGVRLMSVPARPPRGKARFNVYLDEFAHVALDRQIYTGALPIVSKGGRLRIGSSPLGASGVFWEVYGQSLRDYPGYRRKTTPWWEVGAFCTDVRQARRVAPQLLTAERVERFGNDRIRVLHANLVEEDFRQEYECEVVDEQTSWITWDEIKAAQDSQLLCQLATCRAGDVSKAIEAIGQVQALVRAGKIETVMAAGMDIGRTRNASELSLVGIGTARQLPLRLCITLEGMPFDDQLSVAASALQHLPVMTLLIDRNGIGSNIAENMESFFPGKAQGVNFTNASKALWAADVKMLVQQHRVLIPADRDLAYQIHSIKKIVTAAKNLVFDTSRNERHHADKFWAWALALVAAHTILPGPEQTFVYHDPVRISSF